MLEFCEEKWKAAKAAYYQRGLIELRKVDDWGKAEIILQQLGGAGKLQAMVAAHDFTYRPEGVLSFKFKGCPKANIIRIELNANDLYDLVFFKYNKRTYDVKTAKTYTDLYAEDLKRVIEEYTGLYLSL